MRKIIITSATIITLAAGTACAPSQVSGVAARCATTPSGRVIGTDQSCSNGGTVLLVDEPCGPLTITTEEDDGCVRFYDQSDGDFVIKPLSSHDSSVDGPYTVVDVS